MARYRDHLPQLDGDLFLTDGGIETTLIFLEGLELPDFAAFDLLKTADGEAALLEYFRTYAKIARQHGVGIVLEAATWRASRDWGTRLGYTDGALADANRKAIKLLAKVRKEFERDKIKMVISGCIGPRGDGYVPGETMSENDAEKYHQQQIAVFADTAAHLVTAITMNYVEEAIGIVRAARRTGMPVVISFTVETDGNLPTGQPLSEAIEQVDATTEQAPAYYMLNCAHPTHFEHVLATDEHWTGRIRGLRANASTKSHAELEEATELDAGNPTELGQQYARIKTVLPNLNVVGGCCGTDHRHIDEIVKACLPLFEKNVQR